MLALCYVGWPGSALVIQSASMDGMTLLKVLAIDLLSDVIVDHEPFWTKLVVQIRQCEFVGNPCDPGAPCQFWRPTLRLDLSGV